MESAAEGDKNEEPEMANDTPNVRRREGRPSIIGAGSDQI